MQVSAPTNVAARASGDGIVTVTWTNAQTTHDNNEVEYRNITDAGSWTTASAAIAASATTYDVTGLTAAKEYEFRVTALNTAVAQVDTITAVADVADSLDGLYFDVYDSAGPVRVWFDVDNSGTAAPAVPSGGRLLEVTGIVTDDTADDVATAVIAAIDADSEFSAAGPLPEITITNASTGDRAAISAGTSTFTAASTTTEGEDGDSSAVEPDYTVYTRPDAAGKFWGARIEEAATTWEYVIVLEGTAPFLTARATPIKKFGSVYNSINLTDWIFGPEITVPTFVE